MVSTWIAYRPSMRITKYVRFGLFWGETRSVNCAKLISCFLCFWIGIPGNIFRRIPAGYLGRPAHPSQEHHHRPKVQRVEDRGTAQIMGEWHDGHAVPMDLCSNTSMICSQVPDLYIRQIREMKVLTLFEEISSLRLYKNSTLVFSLGYVYAICFALCAWFHFCFPVAAQQLSSNATWTLCCIRWMCRIAPSILVVVSRRLIAIRLMNDEIDLFAFYR